MVALTRPNQTAHDLLLAVKAKYPRTAIVPELTISDSDWLELSEPGVRLPKERRIDALMFQKFQRTALEVKLTKTDFNRDTWHKRRPWARVVHRFVYVVPDRLVGEVKAPYGCGLWSVSEDEVVTVVKAARVQKYPEQLPQEVIQRLAYRGTI